jgi:translation elongation factor EF-1alpha
LDDPYWHTNKFLLLKYLLCHVTGEAADCDVIIVLSTTCRLAAGVSKNGQTPNHALLAFTTGVRQMLHKV